MNDTIDMRDVYCNKLIELARENENIVVFEADLMKADGTGRFFKEFPTRSFDVGIAEANMIGIAAGMSTYGKIPFCTTFAPFATRRCYDQIFISVAYAKRNVKITGTDPGISAELNGGTHMPFEDMGIMRNIPKMVVVEPTDATMLSELMPQIAAYNGAVYTRLFRKKTEKIFEDGTKFDLLKGKKLSAGKDCSIIASGIMVGKALRAAEALKSEGISVGVTNIFTWKPIDKALIIELASESGCIVTAENHNVYNGLGSAVAEVIVENKPVPMERIGIQDEFGEVGKMDYLSKRFNLTEDDIINAVKNAISRK